jgi:hypothetical protein
MVALLAALALAGPPKATIASGSASVPLTISSWCWGGRCGAPFAASKRTLVASPGALVSVQLAFVPSRATVSIGGRRVAAVTHGRTLSWTARRGGGLTLRTVGGHGFVTYVGRLRIR